MNYTKGPWTQGRTLLTGHTSQWTQEQWDQNEAIENRMVFTNFSNIDKGISRIRVATCETKDDARLIAAAPELYEALEDALHELETMSYSHYERLERKIRSAIAKARGEE